MTFNPNPNDPTTAFTYEDCHIRQSGERINLTDMWIANEKPENKEPAQWARHAGTIEFQDELERHLSEQASKHLVMCKSHDQVLLETTRGGRSGSNTATWAHWQLALVYAHYLSPRFYIWCNNVVHNAMMAHGGPTGEPESKVASVFEQHFGRLHQRFDKLAQYAMDNLLIASAIQQLPGRRLDFSSRSKRIIQAVVAGEDYDGMCPCCSRELVLIHDIPIAAEFDHFYGPALNRPEHGWLICERCHDDFTNGSPLLRFGAIAAFHRFQGLVLDSLNTRRSAP